MAKCGACRKKIGLFGFVCKCGGEFCIAHRAHEDHPCTYDYKKEAREELAERLAKGLCIAEKIVPI